MNIMYIVPSLKRDGPNNQMQYIVRNIPKDSNKILIVALGKEKEEDKRFHELGVEIIYCKINLKDIIIGKTKALYDLIDRYQPDIIQTYGIRPDTALSKCRTKSKLITSVRCSIKQCYNADYGRLAGYIATTFHSSKIKDGRTIIACSDAVAQYNREELGIKTDYVVRNAIDIEYNHINITEKKKKRKAVGFSDNDIILVSTGYLTDAKDPIAIAEAVRAFNSSCSDRALKIIYLGDGPLREKLERYNDNNIFLAGHVNNVSEWLDICDIYISASHFEGMPNAVLEGMRAALPVLLSDIPSHSEIIKNSKTYIGEMFHVSDVNSIINASKRLLGHNIQEVGVNARKTIVEDYSSERLEKQYMYIYRELMKDVSYD